MKACNFWGNKAGVSNKTDKTLIENQEQFLIKYGVTGSSSMAYQYSDALTLNLDHLEIFNTKFGGKIIVSSPYVPDDFKPSDLIFEAEIIPYIYYKGAKSFVFPYAGNEWIVNRAALRKIESEMEKMYKKLLPLAYISDKIQSKAYLLEDYIRDRNKIQKKVLGCLLNVGFNDIGANYED